MRASTLRLNHTDKVDAIETAGVESAVEDAAVAGAIPPASLDNCAALNAASAAAAAALGDALTGAVALLCGDCAMTRFGAALGSICGRPSQKNASGEKRGTDERESDRSRRLLQA
jgi:hypothetical protein